MILISTTRAWWSQFSASQLFPAKKSRRSSRNGSRAAQVAAEFLEVREVMSATSTAVLVGPQQQITGASIASRINTQERSQPIAPQQQQITGASIAANLSGTPNRVAQQPSFSSLSSATRDPAAVSVTAPSSAQWGSEFNVTVQIRNNGTQSISNYQYGFTLNTSQDVRAYQLGDLQTRNVNLRPGETDTFTARVQLRSTSSVPYTNYYLGMSLVAEGRDPTANNRTTSASRITIQAPVTPPPGNGINAEPNNSMGQAGLLIQCGRGSHSNTFYGSTGSGADTQDWFRIRLDGTTSGSITLSGMTRDLDLELYNSAGTRIASSARSGTATDAINLNNLGAGDYYVRVVPYGSGSGSAYALRFGLTVR